MTTHTEVRPWECEVCKKCFKTTRNLEQHKNSHNPPKYSCKFCDKKFPFTSSRNNHMKTVHKDQVASVARAEYGDGSDVEDVEEEF